jgi:hypothetical protein
MTGPVLPLAECPLFGDALAVTLHVALLEIGGKRDKYWS